MIDVQGKQPPHDLEAEAAIISAVMIAPECVRDVAQVCSPQDMFATRHMVILEAALAIHEAGGAPDIVTLGTRLHDIGQISNVGGMSYLTMILNCCPNVQRVLEYARLVRRMAVQRRVIAACAKTAALGYLPMDSPEKWLADIRKELEGASLGRDGSTSRSIGECMQSAVKIQAKHSASGRQFAGLSTGLVDVDRATYGLHPGEITLVAAIPGAGKTAYAMTVASNVARYERVPVHVVSIEMTGEQIANRAGCARAGLSVNAMRGTMTPSMYDRLGTAVREMNALPITIEDQATSIEDIRGSIWAAARAGAKLAIIDYLQIISGAGRDENERLSNIMGVIRQLTKAIQIPVIVLSQLNRAYAGRSDHRPTMADVRGSGTIEANSNNIMAIYRDDQHNAESDDAGIAELIILKQREGQTGTIRLAFDGPTTTFRNLMRAA